MRKLNFFLAAAILALLFGGGIPLHTSAEGTQYYLGGMTAGFSLSADGVEIVAFKNVASEEGTCSPAAQAGMKTGDIIVAVEGIHTRTVGELGDALARSGGKETLFTVKRDEETQKFSIVPLLDKKDGKYKIGILIRDSFSGIGTVTYIEKDSKRFGALGHAVNDGGAQLALSDTSVYRCSIIGVTRGERGKAGELRGLIMNDECFGSADKVCETGLYGTFGDGYDFSGMKTVEAAPISQASIGKAVIYSTVDGVLPRAYEIAIAKVDAGNKRNKNFVIKITDEALLRETGGIVQGMSGSPIVQNGKLIGAVTPVFLNDPTRGYGIAIEKMLEN